MGSAAIVLAALFIAGLVTGVLIGLGILRARYFAHRDESIRLLAQVSERENALKQRDEQVLAEQHAKSEAQIELAEAKEALRQERGQATEKIGLLQQTQEQLKKEFENLANRIFEEKGEKFTKQNKESLGTLITPLREQLEGFRKKVEEVYVNEAKERSSLLKEVEVLQKLNQQIGEDATNLTNALRGQSKARGTWGEFVLETVLEQSGLRQGHEWIAQGSFRAEDGSRLQPDVVVYMPGDKAIVIDSKVTLSSYERYFHAENDAEREAASHEFSAAVRTHISGLSGKGYGALPDRTTLDVVLMFIPIEGAFHLVLNLEQSLFDESLKKRIVLVSPSTLYPILKTVHQLWRYERQNQHSLRIATQAGDLYDKLVGFVEHFERVGTQLATVQKTYDSAKTTMSGRGSLIGKAEAMKQLGAEARKSLPADLVALSDVETDEVPSIEPEAS